MHTFSGIPGYPQGRQEPRGAYREELAAPLHDRSLRRPGAPPSGAVALDATWSLRLPAGADAQLQTAAADFGRFLAVCMETPLGEAGGPEISLELAPADFDRPEAYRLEVAPSGLRLTGADPSGLQYALYDLEERMTEAGGPWLEPGPVTRRPWLRTRILRSFFSPYYVRELLEDTDFYPDEYLNRLAHHRINGIWIHVLLREIVPYEPFPEFGRDSAQMLTKLRGVIAKAARYGLRVYLYFCEPRGLPHDDPFWEAHPELQGQRDEGWDKTYAMCSALPAVREWLRASTERLFREAPGLGGAFLITASEHHTNCFSHVGKGTGVEADSAFSNRVNCPRCLHRVPADAVGEIVTAIAEGMHAADPQAECISWDWSWEMLWGPEATHAVIAALPPDCRLMCDFERGNEKMVLGKRLWIDEYSLSFTGPSERFLRFAELAAARGLPLYSKMQFAATHELPNLPHTVLPNIVYDKFARMRANGVQGMLGCWIFGNYPGLITDLAGSRYFEALPGDEPAAHDPRDAHRPAAGPDNLDEKARLLRAFATRYFGPEAAPLVRQAWECFARAWDHYPFHIPLLYDGPHVQGPAFPWFLEPLGKPFAPNYIADQEPGDCGLHQILDGELPWFDRCLGAILDFWAEGLGHLEAAFQLLGPATREQGREYGIARMVYHQVASMRNTFRFYVEREFLLRSDDAEERRVILERLPGIIREEITNAESALPFVEADSRLGWHSEVFGYQYTPEMIRERVATLREMVEVTIPGWLETGGGLLEPPAEPYTCPRTDAAWETILRHLPGVDPRRGVFPL